MRRTKLSLAAIVLIVIALVAAPLMVSAQREITQRPLPRLDRTQIDPANRPAPSLNDDIEVFVQLNTPSVAQIVAAEVEAGRPAPAAATQKAQATKVSAQQAALRASLKAMGVKELSSLRVGANGLRIIAKVRDLAKIRAMPGVISVARVARFTPDNETSVVWIGAPEVWNNLGIDGTGVTIAVIDTGIDYLHANLGGSGNPADYAANDTTIIEPGTFPTAKVIGGYDFAGTSYDANGDVGSTIPSPDPDPLDVDGHGSHVSGTAAGLGVPDLIGPGVAKGASLYALKVFGDTAGSTSLVSDAIEWALDPNGDGDTSDHVDVINMSLGSDFGSQDDPSTLSSQHATDMGVIVAASAGNDGDTPYVTGSPAVAPGVISVAASVDGGFGNPALIINPGSSVAGNYDSREGNIGPPLSSAGPVTGTLVLADPLLACAPLNNAAAVSGNIVLIQRGTCTFAVKHANAEAAGAIGVVVYNSVAGGDALLTMGFATASIPSTFIGLTNGTLIKNAITNGETVNATLQALIEVPHPELADTLADFTSRGPGHGGTTFKPDVAAPGLGIRSTGVGTGDKYSIIGGTSMASPHVAGLAALMRQEHPYLQPKGIKALIQNATVTANSGGPGTDTAYPLARQGVGVVRADGSAGLSSFAQPGGVSFGRINPFANTTVLREVTLHNLSDHNRTYFVSHIAGQVFPGVLVTGPSSVHVPAHSTKSVLLKLKMDPSVGPFDDAFFSQTEVDGWFVFSDGTDDLRVGYLAAVDPASRVRIASNPPGQLKIRNPGPSLGFAEGFTLAARQGLLLDGTPNAIRAFGYRTATLFGVPAVQFGLATEKPWESLSAYETDIYLDTDQDGAPDYILIAADLGYLQGASASGQVVTALFNLSTGDFLLEYYALGDLNDESVVLSVDREGDYGFLTGGDTTFDYEMYTFDLRDGSFDVQTGSIDLADEIAPSDNGFALGPGESATLHLSGPLPGKMLWLFPNNAPDYQSVIAPVN